MGSQPARNAHFVEAADGRRVCYATWGSPSGTPIFSLHGTPGCRLNRYPDDAALADLGIRLVTYDRAGYGQSTRHRGRQVVDCVADVEAIADALGIDTFAVTGGSGGGPHALAVAARLPGRVVRARSVVGAAPYPAAGLDWFEGMDPQNVKEFGWALTGEQVLTEQLTALADETVQRVAVDPSKALGDDWELAEADLAVMADPMVMAVMREALPEAVANGPWGWVDDDLAFTKPWGFDVAEITVPVEVYYGSQDVLVPAGHGRWLAANVPGAVVTVDDSQGHLSTPARSLELLRTLIEP